MTELSLNQVELSLNEVETLAAKAGRGAGFSWGLADDIGKGARHLAIAGLPWAAALLGLAAIVPLLPPSPEHALAADLAGASIAPSVPGGVLCPVRTGALLADRPHRRAGDALRIERVAYPLWLIAFAALPGRSAPIGLSWPGAAATVRACSIALPPENCDWLAPLADVVLGPSLARLAAAAPRRRAHIGRAELDALIELAARTYVPASESSRAKGAGGGRVDDE